jgi:hypothetical protein
MGALTWLVFLAATPELGTAAQESGSDAAHAAHELTNPIAELVAFPILLEAEGNAGPLDDGHLFRLKLQPVVPFRLGDHVKLLSRTIVSAVAQQRVISETGGQTGLTDLSQSFFLSSVKPLFGFLIFGVGPVVTIPTATTRALGSGKLSLGPTAVLLTQLKKQWTFGVLASQSWSVAGASDRERVSTLFLQPFASFVAPTAWTFTLNSESTYSWVERRWEVPITLLITRLLVIDGTKVNLGGGLRVFAAGREETPQFGALLIATPLIPTRHGEESGP